MRGEPRARGFVAAAIETANIVLTAGDARTGATPRDLIWTHQKTTLYR
jgi:polyhydroxyalkanoate synthase